MCRPRGQNCASVKLRWKVWIVAADKQARRERRHSRSHGVPQRLLASEKMLLQEVEGCLPLRGRSAGGVEGCGYLAQVRDTRLEFGLRRPHLGQAAVNAAGEAVQLLFWSAPFFASRLCWSEPRISRSPAAMLKPGGASGPPWSLLSTPRTAAQ